MNQSIKRILALLGVVLLLGLYGFTFFAACTSSPNAKNMFMASLGATVVIPLFLWISIYCIQKLNEKRKH